MYNIYFSAFYAMIDIGKWEYKPKRLLNIRCKNPAGSDALLKTYAVTNEIADAQLLTDYIVMAEKRKSRGRSKKYHASMKRKCNRIKSFAASHLVVEVPT